MTQNLDAYWMPFTANRQFKKAPRLLARVRRHVLLDRRRPPDPGRRGRPVVRERRPCRGQKKIVKAIQDQAQEMDYAPPFQMAPSRRRSSWPTAWPSSPPPA